MRVLIDVRHRPLFGNVEDFWVSHTVAEKYNPLRYAGGFPFYAWLFWEFLKIRWEFCCCAR